MHLLTYFFILTTICLFSFDIDARPISYPGGTTIMSMNNGDTNSVHAHYSPSIHYSVGYKGIYHRDRELGFNGVQLNYLLKRWNNPASQANVYFKTGAGVGYSDRDAFDNEFEPSSFAGFAADWENRRYFVGYENHYMDAGDIDEFYTQKARVGIAPYIGDYGDLHTWLMLQIDHAPDEDNQWTVTPLVRMFKGVHLWETGINNNGEFLLNYIIRY